MFRPRLTALLVFASFVLTAGVANAQSDAPKANGSEFPAVKHFIDTHIHLYDPRRPDGIPWPPATDKVLYKPHLPEEFHRASKAAGVTGVVIVEASDRLEDNRWALDLVENDDLFVGLVGNIDPSRDDFEEQLLKLAKDKRFVGVRARNPKPIDYNDSETLESFRVLAKYGKSLDFLCNGQGIKGVNDVNGIAKAVPELRIVVNHVLGYNIDGKVPPTEWTAAVHQLAQNKNVYCKVSGLFQRCQTQPAPKDVAMYQSVLDILWREFGKERLIYGSNWPCTKNSGDYSSFVKVVNDYFVEKGQDACEHYFWKNAAKAYALDLK